MMGEKTKVFAVGLTVALFLSVGTHGVAAAAFALVAEYLDDGLRNTRRVGAATGLITLGSIVESENGAESRSLSTGRRAEGYRLLLLNLQVATSDQELRTVMVASARIGDGKSITAANLAAVMAESGQRVILVDADLHRRERLRRSGTGDRGSRAGHPDANLGPARAGSSVARADTARASGSRGYGHEGGW